VDIISSPRQSILFKCNCPAVYITLISSIHHEGSMATQNPNPLLMSLDVQVGFTLAAMAAALCKQPGINGQQLLHDFLEALEGIAQSPSEVGEVGRTVASLMSSTLAAEHNTPPPPR
jgi:hypothetical protein